MSDEVTTTTTEPTHQSKVDKKLAKEDLTGRPTNEVIRHGLREGLRGFLDLTKVIVPVYFAVALLSYFGVIAFLAQWLSPVMGLFGLPGEAAIVIMTGYFLTLYSAIGALGALHLPPTAITAIGFMLLFAHALPVEWAILQKMGARAWRITLTRLALSIIGGLVFALFHRGEIPQAAATASLASIPFWALMVKTGLGCANLMGLVFAIIMPVTVLSALARARGVMPKIARRIYFITERIGVGETAIAPLLVGVLFGLLYGGGALIAMTRTGMIKKEDVQTVGTFLGICHSIFEDPLLFVAIGGNFVWLWIIRLLTAVVLTPLLRRWV